MTKKSRVWEYFNFKGETEVNKTIMICNICKCEFKYATGSTSSMSSHLRRKHGIVVKNKQVAEPEVSREKQSSKGARQLRLCDAFALKNKLSRT